MQLKESITQPGFHLQKIHGLDSQYWQCFLIDKWRFVVQINHSNKQGPQFSTKPRI